MTDVNTNRIKLIANGLGDLNNEMVFVGGAVTQLYTIDPVGSEIRVTLDVDCVTEISSKREYAKLEERLRSKGFENDTAKGAPICRWIYKGIKVDIMPTEEEILGFSNQWYTIGMEKKIIKTLPDGTEIFLFPPEIFLAAKIEAHNSRGGKDLRQSHDFEDIIYILDNYADLLQDISNTDYTVKENLKSEFQCLLEKGDLSEGIESALPFGSGQERVKYILNLMRAISKVA